MPKVIDVPWRDLDEISAEALRVTSLEVRRARPDRPVIVLSVGWFDGAQPDGHQIELALSPPAAKQLSRDLQKAVKKYLRAVPAEENQP